MNENNQVTLTGPTQSESDAPKPGQGAATVLSALTDPLKAFLGNQGIGTNVSQIVYASKDDPNAAPYGSTGNPFNSQSGLLGISGSSILVLLAIGVIAYFIFKK